MGDEIRANPPDLAALAGQTLDASITLGDGWRAAQADLAVSAAAFGDLPGGKATHRSQLAATETADTSVGRLVAVYEGDVDRLYRVAFAYQQADQEADRRFNGNPRPVR